jgi:DNA-binding NarL/FixJ family response regulator
VTPVLLDREAAVLHLVAQGLRSPEIASRLGVSLGVVQRHVRSLTAILGTLDRAGMVGAAYRLGVLQPPADPASPPPGFDEDSHALLVLMARGMSSRQIAKATGTTASGVSWRSRRLFGLLGVHDRAHAVHAAVQCGALRLVPVRERVS